MEAQNDTPVKPAFTALVCGGRDYSDRDAVFRALDSLQAKHPNITILQGGASGADALAHEWAMARERPSITVPAEWGKYDKAAGPRRNTIMLHYLPDGVVAFPGDLGTADMCRQAERAKIKVWRPGRGA